MILTLVFDHVQRARTLAGELLALGVPLGERHRAVLEVLLEGGLPPSIAEASASVFAGGWLLPRGGR